MKYYSLSGASEPKVIGVNNGVYQGNIIWKKFRNKNSEEIINGSYFSLEKHTENKGMLEAIDFEIEYIEALKSAKMTDFFKYSPKLWGVDFFITKKVKLLLSQFNLPTSAFIPSWIYHREVKYEYYAMYLATHYREDSFDFSKSLFYEGIRHSLQPKIYIKLNDVVDYKNYKGLKTPEKLKYNEKFDPSLDLFDTLCGSGNYYISERLKNEIEVAGITGIVIREPKEPELIF